MNEQPETEVTRDAVVSLREVTADTVRAIIRLKVKPTQTHFEMCIRDRSLA